MNLLNIETEMSNRYQSLKQFLSAGRNGLQVIDSFYTGNTTDIHKKLEAMIMVGSHFSNYRYSMTDPAVISVRSVSSKFA